jgi:DNA topoisomerase-3
MQKIVLCEKPSQAQAYSAVLGAAKRENGFFIGGGYIAAWCYGHLLELAAPDVYDERYKKWRYGDLPIVPEVWKHVPAKGKSAQLEILKELMNRADVMEIINACDAGREGENIFRLVYEYAKCKKPIKRLWISSMEDAAVRKGFANLKDGAEYDDLYAAASCRERADWLCGISLTRAVSIVHNTTLTVGRVQSPTLAMLVKRESEIANFVKEPFYTPTLDFCGFTASGEKLKDKAAADAIAANCNGQSVTITDIERVTKTVSPPKLYDLTSLQRDANRLLGYTAQQTLDYVQALYEKKLTTYPRTDSKFITADMKDTVLAIIGDTEFTPDVDRLVGTVSDHHAVIPTFESCGADIAAFPTGEREVFSLVCKRLIAAVSPKHVYEAVTVTLDCGGNTFTAKGKTVITPGWKTDNAAENDSENDSEEDANSKLPELSKGQSFDSVSVSVKESFTQPKKHHTEDTLLSAMENAGAEDIPKNSELRISDFHGIGTPSTRANILEQLVKRGYVERSKKSLIPTDKGKRLIAILPASLTSAKLTAIWEDKLLQIQRGELDGNEFMDGIAAFTKDIIADSAVPNPEFAALFPEAKKRAAPELGKCPRCGAPVREAAKGFFCDSRICDFKLWKESKFWMAKRKPLTAAIVTALLSDGKVKLTGLHSDKTGKTYDAVVILDDPKDENGAFGKFVNFKMDFDKTRRAKR